MAGCSAIVPYKDCSRQSLLAGLDLSGLRDVIVWCVSIEQQEEVSQRERASTCTSTHCQWQTIHGCSHLLHRGLEMKHARLFHLILIKSYIYSQLHVVL